MITKNIIKIYTDNDRDLIPIQKGEKLPLHKNWNIRQYSSGEIHDYARGGYSLGFRLSPGDLVIDIDPRNGGNEGLKLLIADFNNNNIDCEDLGDMFPAVKTGGGGLHFYCKIDPAIKVKNDIDRYGKGVEFKAHGRQVIIPGSIHPISKQLYTFDDFSDFKAPSPPAPAFLVDAIKKETHAKQVDNSAQITNNQLAKLLAVIPATDFADNESWFQLLAASHEATRGSGLSEFLAWSLTDNKYIGHAHLITARWESCETDRPNNIGAGTLFKIALGYGATLPKPVFDDRNNDIFGDLPVVDTPRKFDAQGTIDRETIHDQIQELSELSRVADVQSILALISKLNELEHDKFFLDIKAKTRISIASMRKYIKSLKKKISLENRARQREQDFDADDISDISLDITTQLLQIKFANGDHLIHARDQQFWQFKDTHWLPVAPNIIDNMLLKSAYKYRQENRDIIISLSSLVKQSGVVLRARRALDINLSSKRPGQKGMSIINVRNHELHINNNTGQVSCKPHIYSSYLTSCLDTDYDPAATCPMFDSALRDMFKNNSDTGDTIRHLWEVIGYTMQPHKNIASWVLFHGAGANGKTVVLNVITALLGEAALNKSVEELDIKRNNHALADVPNKLAIIDEDLDAKVVLPDATLKKISESKMIQANPKNKNSFSFMNTAIVIFASNEYPKIKDLSKGMRRRALVFNFNRVFEPGEQNLNLASDIIETELAGVLNRAINGLKRLRARGHWSIPTSCNQAADMWLSQSSTITQFVSEGIEYTSTDIEFKNIYAAYQFWCVENGFKNPTTKPNFKKSLVALGYNIVRSTANRLYVKNVKLIIEGE